jgi:hypothetical protein
MTTNHANLMSVAESEVHASCSGVQPAFPILKQRTCVYISMSLLFILLKFKRK